MHHFIISNKCSFINFEKISILPCDTFQYCDKCGIEIITASNEDQMFYFLNKTSNFKMLDTKNSELLPTCDEVIIKNIIE